MIVCHMREKVQNIVLFSIDITLDNWLTLLGLLGVYEILDLRKIMVVEDMA